MTHLHLSHTHLMREPKSSDGKLRKNQGFFSTVHMDFQGSGYHKGSQPMLLKILVVCFGVRASCRGVTQLEVAQWEAANLGKISGLEDCWGRTSLRASQTPSLTMASDMEGVDEIFMNGWNICHCCDKHPRNRMEQRRFILAHGFSPWSADSVVSLRWVNIITRSIWPNKTHTPWQTGSRGRGEDPSFHDLCPL